MKFIRDIIAEKKKHAVSDEQDGLDCAPDLNGAESTASESELANGMDGHSPLCEDGNGSAASTSSQGSTSNTNNDSFSDENRDEPEVTEFEQTSDTDGRGKLSSADSFDLRFNEHDARDAEKKRRKLLDALVSDDAEDEDRSGLIPDEPSDLRSDDMVCADAFDERQTPDDLAEDEPSYDTMDDGQAVEVCGDYASPISEPEKGDDASEWQTANQPQKDVSDLTGEPSSGETTSDLPQSEVTEPAPDGAGDANIEEEAVALRQDAPSEDSEQEAVEMSVSIPKPTAGRTAGKSGRVKTRLLGFSGPRSSGTDPFASTTENSAPTHSSFPVGWLVVVEGPGCGAAFTLFNGVSQIGRGSDQTVPLEFGDNSISRENHAAIAYDNEQRAFYLGHGGKANLVRLNNRPVLSTEEIGTDDQIRIGETVLRFVALCGKDFCWEKHDQDGVQHAASG